MRWPRSLVLAAALLAQSAAALECGNPDDLINITARWRVQGELNVPYVDALPGGSRLAGFASFEFVAGTTRLDIALANGCGAGFHAIPPVPFGRGEYFAADGDEYFTANLDNYSYFDTNCDCDETVDLGVFSGGANITRDGTRYTGTFSFTAAVIDDNPNPPATDEITVSGTFGFDSISEDITGPDVTPPANIVVSAIDEFGTPRSNPLISAFLAGARATDDLDGDVSADIVNDAPAFFPYGSTVVTFSVNDRAGNVDLDTAVVTVPDEVPPEVTAPGDVVVYTGNSPGVPHGDSQIAAFLGAAGALDNVDGDLRGSITTTAPAIFPPGPTTVVFSARDAAGNLGEDSATVTVILDTTPPEVTAPAAISRPADDAAGTPRGDPSIEQFLGAATAVDDIAGDLSSSVTTSAPAVFPLGTTTVTFTAVDWAGNVGSATSQVEILDGEAPVVTAPPLLDVAAVDASGTPATDPTLQQFVDFRQALDDVDGDISGRVTNDAPYRFPLGTTVVIFSATDLAGNTGTATSTVEVADLDPPELTTPAGPASVAAIDADGTPRADAAIAGFLAGAVAVDNVDGDVSGRVSHDAPAVFPLGLTVVSFSVEDEAGNLAIESSSVRVDDKTPPEVTAPAPLSIVVAPGTSVPRTDERIQGLLAGARAQDNVDGDLDHAIVAEAPAEFSLFATTPMTFRATDAAGNTGTAVTHVSVHESDELDKDLFELKTVLGAICPNPGTAVNDPVDTTTGAYFESARLVEIRGAIPLVFELRYNSANPAAEDTGFGWRHDFSARLSVLPGQTVEVAWPSGRVTRYRPDEAGGFVSVNGDAQDSLVAHPDGSYSLADRRQQTHRFGTDGRLLEVVDRWGFAITLEYSPDGDLESITEAMSGRSIHLTHDGEGRIVTLSGEAVGTTTLDYDQNGDLVSVIDALGHTTRYTYDTEHRLLTRTDPLGVTVVTNVYGADGKVVSQDDGRASTALTRLDYGPGGTSVTDREGHVTRYDYDLRFNLVALTGPAGDATTHVYDDAGNRIETTDPLGNTATFDYDPGGYRSGRTDELGDATRFVYDSAHNLVATTNPLGNATTYTYDENDNETSRTDALNRTTQFEYNPAGLLESATSPSGRVATIEYDAAGQVATETDPSGRSTGFQYDDAGRLVRRIDGAGNATTFTYDARGRRLSEADPLGNVRRFSYDALGRLTEETTARGNVIAYAYDENGNLTSITNALGGVTRYAYDAEDRVIRTTGPRGDVTAFTYDSRGNLVSTTDPLGHATTSSYDAVGRIVSTRDALGNETIITYDPLGQITAITDPNGARFSVEYDRMQRPVKSTDPLGRSTGFRYDALGRLVATIDPARGQSVQAFDADGNRISFSDPNGNITVMLHDQAGRVYIRQTPDGGRLEFGYDERGLLSTVTNGRGQVSTRTYDDAGRLTSLANPAGSTSLAHDADGNLLTVSDATGTMSRTYDALGRVNSFTDIHGNTIGYAYDDVGNLTQLTYPDGKTVDYGYDAANRMIRVEDWAGRVTRNGYDAAGRPRTVARPNGTGSSMSHDPGGRLTSLVETGIGGTELYRFDYGYDDAGNLVQEQSYPFTSPPPEVTAMTYGPDNRLEMLGGNPVVHDADGNMTSGPLAGVMRTFTYDARNRLTEAGGERYVYDAEDRRVAIRLGDTAAPQPVAIDNPGFEELVLAQGQFSRHPQAFQFGNAVLLEEPIPGWTVSPVTSTLAAGTFNPPDDVRSPPEGDNSGYAGSVPPGEFQGVTQVLSERIAPSTRYVLEVDGLLYHEPGPYRARLMTGDTVLAEDSTTFDTSGYKTATVSFTSPTDGPLIGTPLKIGIFASGNDLQFDNVRLHRTDPASETRFVVDPNARLSRVLMETDANGTPTAFYVYGTGLIGQERADGAYRAYHYDLRGSTLTLTDESGSVTDRYSYGPYGELIAASGATRNPFRYNGRDGVMTEANGLYFMRARFYDPGARRFLNRDVLLGSLDDPGALNRFTYTQGSPILNVDPSGRSLLLASLAAAAGAAIGSYASDNREELAALATDVADFFRQPPTRDIVALSGAATAIALLAETIGAAGAAAFAAAGVGVGLLAIAITDPDARNEYVSYVKSRWQGLKDKGLICRDRKK